jgi:hypothetical protein
MVLLLCLLHLALFSRASCTISCVLPLTTFPRSQSDFALEPFPPAALLASRRGSKGHSRLLVSASIIRSCFHVTARLWRQSVVSCNALKRWLWLIWYP